MTNEEFQKLVIGELKGLKTEIGGIKDEIGGIKGEIAELKGDILELKAGQERIEKKIDKLAQIENDDIVTIAKTTSDIKETVRLLYKNQVSLNDDISFLVRKTLENSDDIRVLKRA